MKAAILILALTLSGCALNSPKGHRGLLEWIDYGYSPALYRLERKMRSKFIKKDTTPWLCEVYDSSGTCTKWELKNRFPANLK